MKQKLLIFTEYFYPSKKGGGPVTSIINMIDVLHENIDIFLICYDHDMGSTNKLKNVTSDEWNDYYGKAKVFYFSGSNLKKIINEVKLITPNTIYINGIFNTNFIITSLLFKNKAKIIFSPRGMLQKGAISNKIIKKSIYLNILKLFLNDRINWHATDNTEKSDILRFYKTNNLTVIPNITLLNQTDDIKILDEKTLKVCYISIISSKKNLIFVLDLLAKVKRNVIIDVYGPIKDHSYWQKCLDATNKLPSNIYFSYKKSLEPTEVKSILPNYHLLTLPTFGENFGHIIFESFANGVPVLISNNTPWRNLEEKNIGYDLDLVQELWINTIENINLKKLNQKRNIAFNYAQNFVLKNDLKKDYLKLFNSKL